MTPKVPWSPEELAKAQADARLGIPPAAIGAAMCPPRSGDAVTLKLANEGASWQKLYRGGVTAGVVRPPIDDTVLRLARQEGPDTHHMIPEWLDALRPVQLPAPPKAKATKDAGTCRSRWLSGSKTTMVTPRGGSGSSKRA